ncbi:hypothetical protein EKO27_g10164 [Xylaria grammica]|uniref:Uncharacterized protein n=1 Tax=Xylaria grammica TaxID=363999 RepID=A0A439CS81_9PEZI|nr:hypothetical protein EKO27_g10164 [Xylaria grammica]
MRRLWKAFIDSTLNTIETRASTYCTTASKLFVASQGNQMPKYATPGVAAWASLAFRLGGGGVNLGQPTA